jgi:hypothetical protein
MGYALDGVASSESVTTSTLSYSVDHHHQHHHQLYIHPQQNHHHHHHHRVKKEKVKRVKREKKEKWTDGEDEVLRRGVQQVGEGKWNKILKAYREVLHKRTNIDLKDRWRNLKGARSIEARKLGKCLGKRKSASLGPAVVRLDVCLDVGLDPAACYSSIFT